MNEVRLSGVGGGRGKTAAETEKLSKPQHTDLKELPGPPDGKGCSRHHLDHHLEVPPQAQMPVA